MVLTLRRSQKSSPVSDLQVYSKKYYNLTLTRLYYQTCLQNFSVGRPFTSAASNVPWLAHGSFPSKVSIFNPLVKFHTPITILTMAHMTTCNHMYVYVHAHIYIYYILYRSTYYDYAYMGWMSITPMITPPGYTSPLYQHVPWG